MTRHPLHPTRRHMLGLAGAALLAPSRALADGTEALSGSAFGTTWRIVGTEGDGMHGLRPDIDAIFAGIDRQMSPWRSDSVISRFNAGPAGQSQADGALRHVTKAALSIAEQSGGAFDPTVGPLVAQWGFGPISGGATPGWRNLGTGADHIAKARDDTTLDLCGIAKGYALDRAIDTATRAGLRNMLMDLGGELRALGRHPTGRPWQVAVEHPETDRAPVALLRLTDGMAVATSGLKAQSVTLGAQTYGHIIDPAKGAPAQGGVLSVTVLAETAMTADGWATALFAAGRTGGPALARSRGIAALFLIREGDRLRQIETGAFGDHLL